MEDGRWIWKSRVDEPETIVKLDSQRLQAFDSCEKCGALVTEPPVYRVRHKILIIKGWDYLWKSEGYVFFIAVKKLKFVFHQNCFNLQWLQKRYDVWWIP